MTMPAPQSKQNAETHLQRTLNTALNELGTDSALAAIFHQEQGPLVSHATRGFTPRDVQAIFDPFGNAVHTALSFNLLGEDVLITGAGPIGLLAALVGKQYGLEVHVLDRIESGAKPELVRALGATYHTGNVAGVGFAPDVIIECTGVGQVVSDAIRGIGAGGVVCLTGVGAGGSTTGPAVADVAAAAVLKNTVVVGSVNANKRHWYRAGEVLARADPAWLARLITRREPPESFMRALQRQPDDIKVIIQFAEP